MVEVAQGAVSLSGSSFADRINQLLKQNPTLANARAERCVSHNFELVSFLLQDGADPKAKNSEGKTPLTFAQEKNNTRIIELLRKNGAR